MFKDFIVRKMLEQKLKGMPKEEQEKIIRLVTENPEFFKKIQEEVDSRSKNGEDPKTATMAVMQKYQNEIKSLLNK